MAAFDLHLHMVLDVFSSSLAASVIHKRFVTAQSLLQTAWFFGCQQIKALITMCSITRLFLWYLTYTHPMFDLFCVAVPVLWIFAEWILWSWLKRPVCPSAKDFKRESEGPSWCACVSDRFNLSRWWFLPCFLKCSPRIEEDESPFFFRSYFFKWVETTN